MRPHYKMLFAGFAAYAASSISAQAQIVIQPVINAAPVPVYAAPVYAPPPPPYYYHGPVIATYDPHHRRHDYEYWREHHRHDERHYDHR